MLRPRSDAGWHERQRRFCIHCRDQPIEAEHLHLSVKEACIQDSIKCAVPLHQLSGSFRTFSDSARQFVGRIAVERNEVRHLLGINAIPLLDLFRLDARDSPPRKG
jgi:hypothetical protein